MGKGLDKALRFIKETLETEKKELQLFYQQRKHLELKNAPPPPPPTILDVKQIESPTVNSSKELDPSQINDTKEEPVSKPSQSPKSATIREEPDLSFPVSMQPYFVFEEGLRSKDFNYLVDPQLEFNLQKDLFTHTNFKFRCWKYNAMHNDICNYRFPTERELFIHDSDRRYHPREDKVYCHLCLVKKKLTKGKAKAKPYKSISSLRSHISHVHDLSSPDALMLTFLGWLMMNNEPLNENTFKDSPPRLPDVWDPVHEYFLKLEPN